MKLGQGKWVKDRVKSIFTPTVQQNWARPHLLVVSSILLISYYYARERERERTP